MDEGSVRSINLSPYDAIVIAGDFNTVPYEPAYCLWKQEGYRSSYREVNGAEPGKTFPTGLWAECMDTSPAGTFDYIWVKGEGASIKECFMISCEGIQSSDPHQALFPSDHYGIVSVCEIS